MEKTKKNLCRLMGILLAAGLMLPTPGAGSTEHGESSK